MLLQENGFNTGLIKISPKAHIVTSLHIREDLKKLNKTQGTTARGIAPCYSDKYKRTGVQAKNVESLQPFIWDEILYGNILCEGAQGFWLDINQGNYPYTTSSVTLPYGSCSLGFSPKKIHAQRGPKTASVIIKIPTIAERVFFAPIVIKIKPSPT